MALASVSSIPVHNEEHLVSAALDSLDRAIDHVSDSRVSIGIVVVLDRCSDRSSDLASKWCSRTASIHETPHIEILEIEAGNVGSARRAGCQTLLREWSDGPPSTSGWPPPMLIQKCLGTGSRLSFRTRNGGVQVWVGAVNVRDWFGRTPGTSTAWRDQYENEALPVHGANFGIDAATYLETGGFESLATGEDRDLLSRAVALGAVIRHDPLIRVVTSSRRDARAPRGFAHALTLIEATVLNPVPNAVELAAS